MPPLSLILPRPHPAQRLIIQEAGRFNVLCCGRRFGKTILGEDRIIETALQGYPTAWFSDKFASLDEPWRDLKRILKPVTLRTNETLRRLDLITGGSIKMWALEDDPECSRGPKYKRIVIDEAAKIRKLLHAWQSTIRANLTDYAGDAWFLSTPKGRNDFWQLYQFGEADDKPEWRCWRRPTESNPHLIPSEVVALRLEVGPRMANQEVDAVFLEVGGRFFDEWSEKRHVIPDRDIPAHWHKWGSLDGGTASPFSFHLHAASEEGGVETFGECYEAGLLPTAQSALVCALLAAKGIPRGQILIAADTAMFPPQNPAERLGEYQIEAFWRAGLNCVPAVKNRVAGWSRMKEYIHKDGGWRVHQGACPNLIRTLPLMQYDENPNKQDDMDTTLEDHAADDCRYGFMTRPPASAPAPKTPAQLEDDWAAQTIRARQGQLIGHQSAQDARWKA